MSLQSKLFLLLSSAVFVYVSVQYLPIVASFLLVLGLILFWGSAANYGFRNGCTAGVVELLGELEENDMLKGDHTSFEEIQEAIAKAGLQ